SEVESVFDGDRSDVTDASDLGDVPVVPVQVPPVYGTPHGYPRGESLAAAPAQQGGRIHMAPGWPKPVRSAFEVRRGRRGVDTVVEVTVFVDLQPKGRQDVLVRQQVLREAQLAVDWYYNQPNLRLRNGDLLRFRIQPKSADDPLHHAVTIDADHEIDHLHWRPGMPSVTYAHEFGHMIGQPEEYAENQPKPDNNAKDNNAKDKNVEDKPKRLDISGTVMGRHTEIGPDGKPRLITDIKVPQRFVDVLARNLGIDDLTPTGHDTPLRQDNIVTPELPEGTPLPKAPPFEVDPAATPTGMARDSQPGTSVMAGHTDTHAAWVNSVGGTGVSINPTPPPPTSGAVRRRGVREPPRRRHERRRLRHAAETAEAELRHVPGWDVLIMRARRAELFADQVVAAVLAARSHTNPGVGWSTFSARTKTEPASAGGDSEAGSHEAAFGTLGIPARVRDLVVGWRPPGADDPDGVPNLKLFVTGKPELVRYFPAPLKQKRLPAPAKEMLRAWVRGMRGQTDTDTGKAYLAKRVAALSGGMVSQSVVTKSWADMGEAVPDELRDKVLEWRPPRADDPDGVPNLKLFITGEPKLARYFPPPLTLRRLPESAREVLRAWVRGLRGQTELGTGEAYTAKRVADLSGGMVSQTVATGIWAEMAEAVPVELRDRVLEWRPPRADDPDGVPDLKLFITGEPKLARYFPPPLTLRNLPAPAREVLRAWVRGLRGQTDPDTGKAYTAKRVADLSGGMVSQTGVIAIWGEMAEAVPDELRDRVLEWRPPRADDPDGVPNLRLFITGEPKLAPYFPLPLTLRNLPKPAREVLRAWVRGLRGQTDPGTNKPYNAARVAALSGGMVSETGVTNSWADVAEVVPDELRDRVLEWRPPRADDPDGIPDLKLFIMGEPELDPYFPLPLTQRRLPKPAREVLHAWVRGLRGQTELGTGEAYTVTRVVALSGGLVSQTVATGIWAEMAKAVPDELRDKVLEWRPPRADDPDGVPDLKRFITGEPKLAPYFPLPLTMMSLPKPAREVLRAWVRGLRGQTELGTGEAYTATWVADLSGGMVSQTGVVAIWGEMAKAVPVELRDRVLEWRPPRADDPDGVPDLKLFIMGEPELDPYFPLPLTLMSLPAPARQVLHAWVRGLRGQTDPDTGEAYTATRVADLSGGMVSQTVVFVAWGKGAKTTLDTDVALREAARARGLGVVEVPGDGDCFYNAVLQTVPEEVLRSAMLHRGQPMTVSGLRVLLAQAYEHSLQDPDFVLGLYSMAIEQELAWAVRLLAQGYDQDDPEFAAWRAQIRDDFLQAGSWANTSGDIAPQLVSGVLDVTIRNLSPNQVAPGQDVAPGQEGVYYLAYNGVNHYDATRPLPGQGTSGPVTRPSAALPTAQPGALVMTNVDVDMPDVDTPDVDTPDVDTPDVDMPDVDTPDVDTPDVDMPVTTAVGKRRVPAGGGHSDDSESGDRDSAVEPGRRSPEKRRRRDPGNVGAAGLDMSGPGDRVGLSRLAGERGLVVVPTSGVGNGFFEAVLATVPVELLARRLRVGLEQVSVRALLEELQWPLPMDTWWTGGGSIQTLIVNRLGVTLSVLQYTGETHSFQPADSGQNPPVYHLVQDDQGFYHATTSLTPAPTTARQPGPGSPVGPPVSIPPATEMNAADLGGSARPVDTGISGTGISERPVPETVVLPTRQAGDTPAGVFYPAHGRGRRGRAGQERENAPGLPTLAEPGRRPRMWTAMSPVLANGFRTRASAELRLFLPWRPTAQQHEDYTTMVDLVAYQIYLSDHGLISRPHVHGPQHLAEALATEYRTRWAHLHMAVPPGGVPLSSGPAGDTAARNAPRQVATRRRSDGGLEVTYPPDQAELEREGLQLLRRLHRPRVIPTPGGDDLFPWRDSTDPARVFAPFAGPDGQVHPYIRANVDQITATMRTGKSLLIGIAQDPEDNRLSPFKKDERTAIWTRLEATVAGEVRRLVLGQPLDTPRVRVGIVTDDHVEPHERVLIGTHGLFRYQDADTPPAQRLTAQGGDIFGLYIGTALLTDAEHQDWQARHPTTFPHYAFDALTITITGDDVNNSIAFANAALTEGQPPEYDESRINAEFLSFHITMPLPPERRPFPSKTTYKIGIIALVPFENVYDLATNPHGVIRVSYGNAFFRNDPAIKQEETDDNT
ncbi:hypothetical protein SAMN05192558_1041, partial [Actinokineospora alba]